MRTKTIASLAGLLASSLAIAHGPHADIHGAGIMETLLHLLAHAWPVIPIAAAYLLFRRYQTDK